MNFIRSIFSGCQGRGNIEHTNSSSSQRRQALPSDQTAISNRVTATTGEVFSSNQFSGKEEFLNQRKWTLEDANLFDKNGLNFYNQGNLTEALAQYQKGLAIKERLAPNSLAVARSYNNIGTVYKDQGKLAEALEQYGPVHQHR